MNKILLKKIATNVSESLRSVRRVFFPEQWTHEVVSNSDSKQVDSQ